ncbi:hypothetical protein [Tepidibacillus marianensis]|uniref:hypothetical protein n=1 Tax=Tepidibacillus marianensis TaxID=3131995 RepID=UPI0030CE0761
MRMVKTIIYFIISLAILFYAIPRIPLLHADSIAQVFAFTWVFFALLVVGAHLDQLLFLDEEKMKHLVKIKAYKRWEKEQEILRLQSKRRRMVQGNR